MSAAYTGPGAACVEAAVGGSGWGGADSAGGAGAAAEGDAGSAAAASAAGSAAGASAADASAWGGSSGTAGPRPYHLLPPSAPASEETSQSPCSGETR